MTEAEREIDQLRAELTCLEEDYKDVAEMNNKLGEERDRLHAALVAILDLPIDEPMRCWDIARKALEQL